MIDVEEIWIPQIIAYSRIVICREKLRECWVYKRCLDTSVTSFDELIEQIFDDLDSVNIIGEPLERAGVVSDLKDALRGFVRSLGNVDAAADSGAVSGEASKLLESSLWQEVINAGMRLSDCAKTLDYKSWR
jgi:hypothetical protein